VSPPRDFGYVLAHFARQRQAKNIFSSGIGSQRPYIRGTEKQSLARSSLAPYLEKATAMTRSLGFATILLIIATSNRLDAALLESYGAASFVLGGTTYSGTGVYDPINSYNVAGQPWVASLAPLHPIELASTTGAGDTNVNFASVLHDAFPTWTFNFGHDLSANSLVVKAYDVEGTNGFVGIQQNANNFDGFFVQYVPHGTDPTTNIHWIQVVYDNHALGAGGGHGVIDHIVDNGGAANPYYDTLGVADGRNFVDSPGRTDAGASHVWLADLYLVRESPTAANTVDIYEGIEWGWRNDPAPEPASLAIWCSMGIVGVAVRLRRRAKHLI